MRPWLFALMAIFAIAADAVATPQYDVIAALQNLRAGRKQEALALLTRAIESKELKGGELADAFEWRAYLHESLAGPKAARADLNSAIAAQRENPLRYRARARLLIRLGEFQAALDDMNTVETGSPTDSENLIDVCEILLGLGRRTDALKNCQSAVRVNPDSARAKAMLRRAGGR